VILTHPPCGSSSTGWAIPSPSLGTRLFGKLTSRAEVNPSPFSQMAEYKTWPRGRTLPSRIVKGALFVMQWIRPKAHQDQPLAEKNSRLPAQSSKSSKTVQTVRTAPVGGLLQHVAGS